MLVSERHPVWSYGVAAVGILLAGLSPWWLAPLIGDSAPVRLLLVVAVTTAAWIGGAGPGLFATVLGILAIVGAQDASDSVTSLTTRLVRFGSLALLITFLFKEMHASRRRAEVREEAYRLGERRYRRLVETAGEGIWAIDRQERTTYANPRLAEILGVPPERLIGRPLKEFLADTGIGAEAYWSDAREGLTPWREVRLIGGDGGVRSVLLTVRPIGPDEVPGGGQGHPQGAPGGLLLMVSDVTPLKQAEAALRQAKEQAEAASQAKDRFLAVLSHELRTPLTPVLIAVSSLLESDVDPALVPALEMIRRNIELEARLIDDLLDISRIARGRLRLDLEVVDIHAAIRRAVEICLDEALVAGLDVVTALEASRYHVTADYARVMQIVWNLIRNAAKFTPAGGRLIIRSANAPARSEDDEFPNGMGSPWLAIEFEDTGIGIDAEFLPRIFQPFEQGEETLQGRAGGLGLGLAISLTLAEALGGRLSATSPGRGLGSTFRLELETISPLADAASRSDGDGARPLASPLASTRGADLRILLVEDNQDTLRYLATVLRQHGHDVVPTGGCAAALAALEEAEVPFDLLLSDIELPDGSGLDLMRALRPDGRIAGIAMSGFGAEEDLQLSREAGFLDHLTKPIDMNRLTAAIQRVTATPSDLDGEGDDARGLAILGPRKTSPASSG